jgi:hypothetical protein
MIGVMNELAPAAPVLPPQEERGSVAVDYGRLFVEAWHLTRRHRFLWGLGLRATAGGALGNLLWRLLFRFYWRPDPRVVLDGLEGLGDGFIRPGVLVGAVVGSFVGLLLFWLVSTVAEGGLIEGVGRLNQGKAVNGRKALSAGVEYLGRLVALDTVLFFPLFVVLLVVMSGGTAVIVGTVLSVVGGTRMEHVATPALVAVVCLGSFSFLTLPVTVLTLAFRLLSFRAMILDGLGVKEAIRAAAGLLRRSWGHILVILAFTWVVQYLLSLALSILLAPLSLFESLPVILSFRGGDGSGWLPLSIVMGLISSILLGAFHAVLYSYSSALWTVAYEELRRGELALAKPRAGA